MSDTRPNILLVVLDTARADAFEPYGAAAGCTPAIAQLASRGAAVETAIAAASWTVPSHAAMFTGLLPRETGLGQAPDGSPQSCAPRMEAVRDRLLPVVFKRAGYSTAAMSANMWIREASGFGIGFDRFVQLRGRRAPEYGRTLRRQAQWAIYALRSPSDDGADEALSTLRRWLLEREPRDPFLWFVNLVECHSPYLPPRAWSGLGPLERMRAGADAARHLSLPSIWRACLGGFDVDEGALARMRHLYARAIRSMDQWLGDVCSMLDEHGILDETLVVVTSDHGENFGEQRLMGHCFSLDQRLIRVPLVSAGPGALQPPGVLGMRALPGLLATAANVVDHPWDPAPSPGVAVSQFDALVPAGDARAVYAAREYGLGEEAVERMSESLTSATDGLLKVLRDRHGDRVCDLTQSPGETEWADVAEARAKHGAGPVDRLLATVEAASVAPATPAPPVDGRPLDRSEVDEIERQMRLLGYM